MEFQQEAETLQPFLCQDCSQDPNFVRRFAQLQNRIYDEAEEFLDNLCPDCLHLLHDGNDNMECVSDWVPMRQALETVLEALDLEDDGERAQAVGYLDKINAICGDILPVNQEDAGIMWSTHIGPKGAVIQARAFDVELERLVRREELRVDNELDDAEEILEPYIQAYTALGFPPRQDEIDAALRVIRGQ